MAKRVHRRAIKIHRNYTMEEAATALGIAKGTVGRWIKSGDLPAIVDHRPHLILGRDLAEFLKGRSVKKQKCRLHECHCFSCRAPREAAALMADFWTTNAKIGHMQALCATCGGLMNKRVSLAQIGALQGLLHLTIIQAPSRIGMCDAPCLNADL
jgi:excisionase family DNA binding protein